MDRLKGLGSFVVITAIVFLSLRLVHVATPMVFPSTRIGPIEVASLDGVQRLIGFAPIVPAYRPARLGDRPARITVAFSPRPTFTVTWQADGQFLTVTQRQGGPRPDEPPISQTHRLIVERGGFWIEIETSLPASELQRFADTLSVF